MLDLKYLPVHFSFFLIIGIVFGYTFDFSLAVISSFTFLFFFVLIYLYFKAKSSFNLPIYFVIFTGILFLNIGILSMSIQKPQYQKKHYINYLTNDNQSVLRIDKILKSNKYYDRYEAQIIQINNTQTKGKILVRIV